MMRFILPLGVFLLLALFLALGLKLDPREVPSPLIDKPAPAFAAPALARPEQQIQRDALLGQVWVLNVWASWCVACREEHPLLVEFSKRAAVPIYGLNYKDQRADALGWLSQFGNPYTESVFDGDGRIGINYGVYGVPETFVIDRQGLIRLKHIGPLTPDVLRDKIEPQLKKLSA